MIVVSPETPKVLLKVVAPVTAKVSPTVANPVTARSSPTVKSSPIVISSLTPTPPVTTKAPEVELVDAVPEVIVVSPETPKVLLKVVAPVTPKVLLKVEAPLTVKASSIVVVPPAESIVRFPEAVSISLSPVTPI